MNHDNVLDDLDVLLSETAIPRAKTDTGERTDRIDAAFTDGTSDYAEYFGNSNEATGKSDSPESVLIGKVASKLKEAMQPEELKNATNDELMSLVKELAHKKLAFYIGKGMLFLTLKTRFPREREFFDYVKTHSTREDHLERRSIETYMRVCRFFWLELPKDQREGFAHYYGNVRLNRLELLAREGNRNKWFFGKDSIILQECQGAGHKLEECANLEDLEKALNPVTVAQEVDSSGDGTPPQDSEEEHGEPPNLTPLPTSTFEKLKNDAEIRVEGVNITQTEDGQILALPGARIAVWLECVPLAEKETQRCLHVYDGDLDKWYEVELPDYVID